MAGLFQQLVEIHGFEEPVVVDRVTVLFALSISTPVTNRTGRAIEVFGCFSDCQKGIKLGPWAIPLSITTEAQTLPNVERGIKQIVK